MIHLDLSAKAQDVCADYSRQAENVVEELAAKDRAAMAELDGLGLAAMEKTAFAKESRKMFHVERLWLCEEAARLHRLRAEELEGMAKLIRRALEAFD